MLKVNQFDSYTTTFYEIETKRQKHHFEWIYRKLPTSIALSLLLIAFAIALDIPALGIAFSLNLIF